MLIRRMRSFTVEGVNLERFVQKAASQKILLYDVKREEVRRIRACASENQMASLLALAEEGGWRMQTGAQNKAGRMQKAIHSRWMLAAAMIVALAAAMYASCCFWRIEVIGAGVYEQDIRTFLHESGVQPPSLRSAVDLEELKQRLIWRYPKISWMECAYRGTTLQIRVHPGVVEGETPSSGESSRIIAARSGIIVSVVTASGTAAVKAGDMVQAGDVLIHGYEKGRDGEEIPVYAKGVVLARVWEKASAVIPLRQTETDYTGQSQEVVTAETPWFPLWQPEAPEFSAYDTTVSAMPLGGIFIPTTAIRRTSMEYVGRDTVVSAEEAQRMAGVAALRKLHAQTGYHDDFVDKWVEYSMIEDESVCASAYGERLVDIAIQEADPP